MTPNSSAFDFAHSTALNTRDALIREAQNGLRRRPRSLPPWMLYDRYGSHLFERITQLPEYYLTRLEINLLSSLADSIVGLARQHTRQPVRLLELGAGTAAKTGILLSAIRSIQGTTTYIPVDVSSDALDMARERIASCLPEIRVQPIVSNYVTDPPLLEAFNGTTLAIYLGSSIGNFSLEQADAILRHVRSQLQPGDVLLLGTDLIKDAHTLEAAYDDRYGVTAAFNLNILRRLNRELGANFELASYQHRAAWNARESRIEMHLESTRDQDVQIEAAHLDVHLAKHETIHTENSYKFTRQTVGSLLERASFTVEQSWTDERGWYAVTLGRA